MKKIKILVYYSEIGLKGKNQSFFINKLKSNIQKSTNKAEIDLVSIKFTDACFLCEINEENEEKIIDCFTSIFGIKYFSFVEEIEKSKEVLFEKFNEICKLESENGTKTLFPKTKRSDKNFELISPQINSKFREIAEKYGIIVDFKDSSNMIFIRINKKSIFISSFKYYGFAGLPVGTAGRVLVLLSGGIDSPVAAWSLMRRGCNCDFLHLHNLADNNEVLNSKIVKSIKVLNKFQYKSTLFTLPYEIFEFGIMDKCLPRYDLVIFKYYLLKLADKLAEKYDYLAIANGDSLAQVASQTLENLSVVNFEIEKPIFRPLLTFEKEEIITLSRKIGTFDLSIQVYKDCCSLVAKNPLTKSKQDKFKKSLENIGFEKLINKSLKKIEYFRID